MAFCMICGRKIPENGKFCAFCGTPVGSVIRPDNRAEDRNLKGNAYDSVTRKQEYAGKIVKCPNCGAVMKSMDAVCDECGFQITGIKAADSVREFSQKLFDIEQQKKTSRIPFAKMMAAAYGDDNFQKKISLISSFPVPNTIEEITEFVLLADANIDVRYGKRTLMNKTNGRPGSSNYVEVKLAETWIMKLKQVYKKAEIAFGDDPAFERVKDIVAKKMKQLKIKDY